jgi:cell division protein YceG involved in septum cleavage
VNAVTKNELRGFAAGILLTCAVFAFFYYLIFNQGEQKPAKNVVKQTPLTEATVTQYLASHHRKAIDLDAYNQWQNDTKKATEQAGKEKTKTDNDSKKKEKAPEKSSKKTTYKLHIKSGMTPGDISNELVSAKILKSNQKRSFDSYLHKNKLEKYVQLGTFSVSSDMSIPKLAQVITKNHSN